MSQTSDHLDSVEQGQGSESGIFRLFSLFGVLIAVNEEGFEQTAPPEATALPEGAAASPQHGELPEVGAYFVPVGDI